LGQIIVETIVMYFERVFLIFNFFKNSSTSIGFKIWYY